MVKMLDRLLMFLYSLFTALCAVGVMLYGFNSLPDWFDLRMADGTTAQKAAVVITGLALFLVSLRFLYISVRSGHEKVTSIDQRTELGDIRISLDTIENLALKAGARIREAKDLHARVHVTEAGLSIRLRAMVDGDQPIPEMSETLQRTVKAMVEEVTGIPVADVSVYVANVVHTPAIRSRVE